MTILMVNSVLEWLDVNDSLDSIERILWIDGENEKIVVISLTDFNAFPAWRSTLEIELALKEKRMVIRPVDPFMRMFSPNSDYVLKHSVHMENNWRIIESLVQNEPQIYDRNYRGMLVNNKVKELGIHKMTLYKFMRRYWIGGKTKYALLPNYHRSGGRGKERIAKGDGIKRGRPSRVFKHNNEIPGVNVTEEIKSIFKVSISMYYDSKMKIPLKRTYDKMIQKFFTLHEANGNYLVPDTNIPTFGQFKYWFSKEHDLKKTVIARHGENEFNLKHRAVLGTSTAMAFGPGSIYQIDATIGDVYLVSSFDRSKLIGRPVIYVVIDVFSRMIVGFHVSLEGPSWAGAMIALANTMMDKVDLCKEYGISITSDQWPAKYLPESILADRGEMISHNSDRLIDGLGITIHNTPPFRADWKGIVEQTFRLLNLEFIKWLPGSVQGRIRERGQPDSRLDAKLDLNDFRKIFINLILKHNNSHYMERYSRSEFQITENVSPIPLNLWEWGITNRTGHLRQLPEDLVKLTLLPTGSGLVTQFGIRFKGMYYSSDLAIREQWFEEARKNRTRRVNISFDPRLMDVIYLHKDNGQGFEPCTLLEREARYRGHCMEDVEELFEIEKLQKDLHEPKRLEDQVNFNADMDEIVKEATKKTNMQLDPAMSKSKRVAQIKQNRVDELERINETNLRKARNKDTELGSKRAEVVPIALDSPSNVEKNKSNLDFLRNRHKNRGDD